MRHIATNAGAEGSIVVSKVKEMKQDEGFNAATEVYEDLVKAGVIDPAKVVRSALQNAASIASLLLTTEALISEFVEESVAITWLRPHIDQLDTNQDVRRARQSLAAPMRHRHVHDPSRRRAGRANCRTRTASCSR